MVFDRKSIPIVACKQSQQLNNVADISDNIHETVTNNVIF